MTATAAQCRCGHPREAHEHYRAGSDCALCGPDRCSRYRPGGGVAARAGALLGRLLRRGER